MFENESLKCTIQKLQQEIFQLTGQLKPIELRLGSSTGARTEEGIEHLRIGNEMTKCPLNDPSASNTSN
ncbi:hypothetical protein NC653_000193 [Populus alba x Populus x berolinensis]|uniref:Uncharacterized protein n=1 Tax=Populus alba x Populus x berolinensis TaxID=444605 RepID=A0AAD6RIQ7_9ROSI|nr:hypothetical protein NC653_000193 [Populus alba x Populus x berolinensis]